MITTLTPRENRILALQTGSFSTKAGLIDHLTVPIVSISSQVGIKLRKSRADEDGGDGSTRAASPNGGEPELDIMMQDPPAPEAGPTGDAPSAQVDPSSVDDASPEGLKALDAHPNILKNGNAYIAGAKLSAERTLETPAERPDIIRPIKQGLPVDWPALAGLWQHLLLRELPFAINRSRNDWSLLLTVPVSWGRDDHARATKIMFEDLNMLAFTIIEQPLVTLYGCNMTTGLVIDIGHETTDVTPILDNSIIRHAHKSIAVGGRDIEKHLARLLREDPTFMKQLGDEELTEAMVRTVKEAVCEVVPLT
ncbi:Actin-like protein arp9 (SWI/SNF complex component arp9) [Thoreauomyces humboldtii]|nr:Actin-like protein arp9 (SWI/SNF complex component arp9) [Thoreauomyces humboldtii]